MKLFNEYELDELIHQYMDEVIEIDDIVEFCDNLELNDQNKKMLIECIDCYDIEVLYETLFSKFTDILTEKEKVKYRERAARIFDPNLFL